MRCAVLGPLEVRDDRDELVGVAGAKERQLLAVLAAACPSIVSVDQLLELLWEREPPPSARKSLQAHVVHLRSALEPDRPRGSPGRYVVRRGTGYALALTRDQLDTLAFTDATARGRALASSGDVTGAADILTGALGLWRGEPYADWPTSPFAELERHRLHAVRTNALQALIEAQLALGHHVDAAPDLERLVREQPLHETWWELLTVALYRSGRQGDALATVRRARTLLAEELGVDPGPRLRAVEQAVLVQATELDLPPAHRGNGSAHNGAQGRVRVEGCPYKGLDTYATQDAAVFRGRGRLVESLVGHLVDHRLLVVSGSSGAGKSSLVRAGLLAALGRGGLDGSRHWRHMVVTPTSDPVDALAPLTGESQGDVPVVLVCDQLEQLWSSETGAAERSAFLDTVLGLLDDGVVPRAVLVLRGDYVGRLAEHASVAEHLAGSLVLVPPLSETELREVVQEPAWAAGLEIEPELVDVVVQEVLGRSGALPLLSAALVGTWQRRRGDLLTLAGYLAAGGVTGAVARTAESVYASFDDESQEVARRVLVRLADQDGRGAIQLRRIPLGELELTGRRRTVVEAMVAQRLLTLDGESLAVTHETLLHAWPRLAGWLADDAVARSVRRQVAPAAREWDRNGRPDDDLYRGARLAAASDWATDPDSDVTSVERDFVQAGLLRSTTELHEARQRADREAAGLRRTRRLAMSLATMLVLALVATASAVGFQRAADLRADEATTARLAADDARIVADANRLAAVAALVRPLDLSLLLAAAAVQLAPTPSTEDGLLSALMTHRRAVAVYPVGTTVNETAVGRDGETMIMNVGGGERHVALWEVGSREAPRLIDDWWPDSLAASPDGRLLVAAGSGGGGTLRVYRPDGERVLYMEDLADDPGWWPREVAFTDDGRLLVVYATQRSDRSGWRTVLGELDPDTGRVVPLHRLLRSESPDLWFTADFNEDASEVVVWTVQDQSMATRYDVETGAAVPLRQERRDATSVDFLALREDTVQTWSDGTVTRFDATGTAVQELDGHTAVVRDVVEVRDGRGVMTVGEGGQAELWDVDPVTGRWTRAESLVGHSGHIAQAEVLHGGRTLLTSGADGRVIAWDLTSGAGLGSATPALGDRWFSNRIDVVDPGRLVVGPTRPLAGNVRDLVSEGLGTPTATDGFLQLDVAATFLDPRTGRVVDEVEVGETGANTLFGSSVAVSPDARLVSVTSKYRTTVLDTRTREVVATIELPSVDPGRTREPEPVWCSAWSPDGAELILCAEGSEHTFEDGGLVVVDSSDWTVDRRVDIGGAAQVLEWNPDHTTLAVGMEHQSVVKVLDPDLVVRGRVQLRNGDQPFDLAFSRDGSLLAAGGARGLVSVIDPVEVRLVKEPAQVHSGPVLDAEWLDGHTTVVTTGMDEQATRYDVDRDLVQAVPFPGTPRPGDGYLHLMPDPDEEIVLLNGDAHGFRYPLEPARWLAAACTIAGRDLTEEEWARYLPDRTYSPTCSPLLGQ